MIVVDTSVLVDFLRGHASPAVDRLRQLELDEIPFAIPVVCAQEVLQGALDEAEWNTVLRLMESQHLAVSTDPISTHVGAARIYYDCRRAGITIRSSTDCLIAQLVLEREDVLLHSDVDYTRISQVRPLQTLTK